MTVVVETASLSEGTSGDGTTVTVASDVGQYGPGQEVAVREDLNEDKLSPVVGLADLLERVVLVLLCEA